jgi:hypothetical protein
MASRSNARPGGSDRAADRWREDYRIDGVEDLDCITFTGRGAGRRSTALATPFAPRCLKDVVEEELFARRRDCSARSISCLWTRPASISRERPDRPSDTRAAIEERRKCLVGNKGYRRFLATPDDDHFAVDRAKAEEDAKFDGIFVLRTNADLTPLEAMLCYKRLWIVERAFRTLKSLFATRPIFDKLDETIRGRLSCSFLALVLKRELEDPITNMGKPAAASDNAENGSWPDVLADLDSLTETEVEQDGKRFSCARRRVPRRASPYVPPASLCHRQCVNSPTPDPVPPRRRKCMPRRFSSADLSVLSMCYKFQLLKISQGCRSDEAAPPRTKGRPPQSPFPTRAEELAPSRRPQPVAKNHRGCEVHRRARGRRQAGRPSGPNHRRLILQAVTKNRR